MALLEGNINTVCSKQCTVEFQPSGDMCWLRYRVGTGDSKCGMGQQCAMSAVVQQSGTYFNMAAKCNDLLTDEVWEAVLADRDESQESEEIDEQSVDGESEEDINSKKIELCL